MKNRITAVLLLMAGGAHASGVGLVGGLVGGAVGSVVGKSVAQDGSIEKSLQKTADGINAKGPRMIDDATRMDGVTVGPGRIFTYHHTMVKFLLKDVDMAVFEGQHTNDTRARICATQGVRPMLANGVTIVYAYKTKDGKRIGSVPIDRKHCGI